MKMTRLLLVFCLLFVISYAFAIPKLVGTFAQAGHSDWDTADTTLTMTALMDTTLYSITLNLPVGTYLYKVVDGSTWNDPNYPSENQTIEITEPRNVTWFCNNVARLVMHTDPIVAGSFFSLIGGTDWDPTNGLGAMAFQSQATMIYTWEGLIPAGTFAFKVTLNHNWIQNPTTNDIGFVSDGTTPTLITYNFYTNVVTTSAGAPPSATITFTVNDTAGQTHTAFYLKGSWNVNGNYDPTWGQGMEHIVLTDDGLNGDVTAGDHIFTAVQSLVTDAGASTWSWGVNDETHTWVNVTYQTFNLPTADPQAFGIVLLGGLIQPVSVLFQLNVAGGDPAIYAHGLSVQGDVLPLDWTNGSHMLGLIDNIYTMDVIFPVGSPRYVQYKFGAFDSLDTWTWESFGGNHFFIINDSSGTQILPVVDFFPVANNDHTANASSLKLSNSPNPFIGNTTISYETSKSGRTAIDIYNLKGQLVRTLVSGQMEKGNHIAKWDSRDKDGRQVASGVYVYRLRNNGQIIGKKMVLLK